MTDTNTLTPTDAQIEALARKHGATSYRNRADTQNPAYGFTPAGILNLVAEVTGEVRKQDEALIKQLMDGMACLIQAYDLATYGGAISSARTAVDAARLRLKGDHIAQKGGQHGTE